MPDHGILDAGAMVTGLRERLSARIADRLAPRHHRSEKATAAALGRSLAVLLLRMSPQPIDQGPRRHPCRGRHRLPRHGPAHGRQQGRRHRRHHRHGSRGSQFIGMAPFVEREHFIQNIGDGTFFHSGQLVIQASVAAGMNTTYKLLYNGTVAMTGGQDAVGGQTVPEIATALLAHGVAEVLVTTDDVAPIAAPRCQSARRAMKVWERDRVVEAQEYLATVPGVTVMIHDQVRAQARRLRKRGLVETPPYRMRSTTASAKRATAAPCRTVCRCRRSTPRSAPRPRSISRAATSTTRAWRATAPVSSRSRPIRRQKKADSVSSAAISRSRPHRPTRLARPANGRDRWHRCRHRRPDRRHGCDARRPARARARPDRPSQKAGRVSGDLRITTDAPAPSNLIGDEGADVIIAFDLLGAASPASLSAGDPTRTVLIGSASETPTGSMIGKPEVAYPELDDLRTQVAAATLTERNRYVDAAGITEQLLGSAASANIFLLGFAYQHGVLPIAGTAIEEAIRLNGVAVEANLTAFAAGRAEAVSADTVVAHADGPQVHVPALPGKLATGRRTRCRHRTPSRRPARLPKCRTRRAVPRPGRTSRRTGQRIVHRGSRYQPSPSSPTRTSTKSPPLRPRGDRRHHRRRWGRSQGLVETASADP